MRKNKQDSTQYSFTWEDSSYQTGTAKPPKQSNGLVAVLLVAVIFLGGMASAMGIINFRLIAMMDQQEDPVMPLASEAPADADPASFMPVNEDPIPNIPENASVTLLMEEAAAYMSAQQIYEYNEQSLVTIHCTTGSNETRTGGGVVLSRDGFILTNAHIIESATRIYISLADGRMLRAVTVGTDALTDLAVLYINAQNLIPALFADSALLQPEETVYALSTGDDGQTTILSGTVQALHTMCTCQLEVQVLHCTLEGNAGPVFNARGQIVALQSDQIRQYFPDTTCPIPSIAIPSDLMNQVIQELVSDGRIQSRPDLGIQVEAISKLYQHYWNLPGGLLVTLQEEQLPAANQVLHDGDILLSLGGTALTSRADLYAIVYAASVGQTLEASVFRDGQIMTLELVVTENSAE